MDTISEYFHNCTFLLSLHRDLIWNNIYISGKTKKLTFFFFFPSNNSASGPLWRRLNLFYSHRKNSFKSNADKWENSLLFLFTDLSLCLMSFYWRLKQYKLYTEGARLSSAGWDTLSTTKAGFALRGQEVGVQYRWVMLEFHWWRAPQSPTELSPAQSRMSSPSLTSPFHRLNPREVKVDEPVLAWGFVLMTCCIVSFYWAQRWPWWCGSALLPHRFVQHPWSVNKERRNTKDRKVEGRLES